MAAVGTCPVPYELYHHPAPPADDDDYALSAMSSSYFSHGGRISSNTSSSASTSFSAAAGLAPAPPHQFDDICDYLFDDDNVSRGAFTAPPPPPGASDVPPRHDAAPAGDTAGSAAARDARSAAEASLPTTERPRTTERIAFRTRSTEVEVLDDGYKWRKYGKKLVKNSPSNPRNYYRCSTEGCNVKKRVERDMDDPGYVVTTYDGTHNHVSPTTVYYASQDAVSGRFFVAGTHPSPPPTDRPFLN